MRLRLSSTTLSAVRRFILSAEPRQQNNVAAIREKRDFTQGRLARNADVELRWIVTVENLDTCPPEIAQKISDALGVPVERAFPNL